jgi:hypothetical protein
LYAPLLTEQFIKPAAPVLSGNRSLDSVPSGTYTTDITGNLGINASVIDPGKTIVIVATGTVTIKGDITYNDGPYASVEEIPQVVIKAAEIRIQGSVGNIDAWLIATTSGSSGKINTCSDVLPENKELTDALCNNPLRINGPVVTDMLYLRRTAGSAGSRAALDEPAEIFNLRADAYMWGSGYGTGNSKVQTVYTKELPPRF